GEPADSRLMSRYLYGFRLLLVGSPRYLAANGTPRLPADLARHACLQHKFPSTGKLEPWPLRIAPGEAETMLPTSMVCNTSEALVDVARAGLGIACLPDFMVQDALASGELHTVLDDFNDHRGSFRML